MNKSSIKTYIMILFYGLIATANAQKKFKYQQQISGVSEEWHQINLSAEALDKINENFSDIRIYEYTKDNDTLEIPYFILENNRNFSNKGVNFKLLNQVEKEGDFYINIALKELLEINEIELNLTQKNYDYKIKLSGSTNQKDWYTIVDDYRIISIQNKLNNYQFSKIKFKNTQYKYYQIQFKKVNRIELKSASVKQYIQDSVEMVLYQNQYKTTNNTKEKKTSTQIFLNQKVALSELKIQFEESGYFYRPIRVKYLQDSIPADNGWHYNYVTLIQSYVSSLESPSFQFNPIFTNKILIEIDNADNQALTIQEIETKGFQYKLCARFNKPESSYFLYYGNKNIVFPNYDIIYFKDKIPTDLQILNLGEVVTLDIEKSIATRMIENKNWLWAVLILLILILAYATFSMLKKS